MKKRRKYFNSIKEHIGTITDIKCEYHRTVWIKMWDYFLPNAKELYRNGQMEYFIAELEYGGRKLYSLIDALSGIATITISYTDPFEETQYSDEDMPLLPEGLIEKLLYAYMCKYGMVNFKIYTKTESDTICKLRPKV